MYTPGEWSKEALIAMIEEYQKHMHLYDQKNQLYYNKNARKKALQAIQKKVEPHRPDTTEHDIYKKIQTLRTQYGQELTKVKKSLHLGDDFKYSPKIWWFEHLSFLKPFIKTRVGGSSLDSKWASEHGSDEETLTEIQVTTIPEPKGKRKRPNDSSEITVVQKTDPNDSNKEKYVIYEENLNEESTTELNQQSEIIVEPYQPKETKRHDEIGKFVAAQMSTITDDLLFYSTQHEILTIINKAQIKQLEKNLTGQPRMYNIIETAE